MNQVEAIFQVTQGEHFERGFHRVYICPDCMNAILDSEEQSTEVDLGTIKILDEKWHTCEIINLVDEHDYRELLA